MLISLFLTFLYLRQIHITVCDLVPLNEVTSRPSMYTLKRTNEGVIARPRGLTDLLQCLQMSTRTR